MPGRTTVFVNNYFYHVYNRGVEKKQIFIHPQDYQRFLKILYYYQFEGPKVKFSLISKQVFDNFHPNSDRKLVDIICYCLMPNHFHFVLKQLKDDGISKFISQISNSYTKFFNTKYNRVGALFQGVFQAVMIESDEQLIHTSRYIHLNPVVSSITKDPNQYVWSSYNEYLSENNNLCIKDLIINMFPSREAYEQFVLDQVNYGKTLETLKHKTLDNE